MSFYGIDLHSDRFTVAKMVLKEEGFQETLGTYTFEERSWKKFRDSLSQKDYILVENSTNAFWFHDQVAPRVKACYVYDTNDIRRSGNKTDKIDAKKLARKLAYYVAMGEKKEDLPSVYVPDPGIRELRGLFTTYRLYNKMKVQVKNRIHSILKANGICIDRGKIDRKAFQGQIEEFAVEEVWKLQMRSAYRELQSLTKEQEEIKG